MGNIYLRYHKEGQGPQEYTYMEDFNIDPSSIEILIWVLFGEILSSCLDGSFIRKVQLPNDIIAYNEVHVLNQDTLLFVLMGDLFTISMCSCSHTTPDQVSYKDLASKKNKSDRKKIYWIKYREPICLFRKGFTKSHIIKKIAQNKCLWS